MSDVILSLIFLIAMTIAITIGIGAMLGMLFFIQWMVGG